MARWSGIQESKAYALASSQHGLVTWDQLHALGASRRTLGRRLRAHHWRRLFPGVFRLLPSGSSAWHQQLMGVCLWLGPEAAVSHHAAANLWELDGFEERPIEVSLNRRHSGRAPSGITIHRVCWVPKDNVTTREGIPVTTVARTLLDAARVGPSDQVDAGLDCALRKKLLNLKGLKLAVEKIGHRGVGGLSALRALLNQRGNTKPKDSEQERWFYEHIIGRYGLPKPLHNFPVVDETGRLVARVDAAYPEWGIAIELQSKAHHSSDKARLNDSRRRNLLVRAGFHPLEFWCEDVIHQPEKVAQELWATLGRVQATSAYG